MVKVYLTVWWKYCWL